MRTWALVLCCVLEGPPFVELSLRASRRRRLHHRRRSPCKTFTPYIVAVDEDETWISFRLFSDCREDTQVVQ